MAPRMTMDLCSDLPAFDREADRRMFEEFMEVQQLGWDSESSVADASMSSASASDSAWDNARSTTLDSSEVTSPASSYDLDRDVPMRDSGANSRDHAGEVSGLDSSSLLIPVLSDKHKERTVTDRPADLPPTGRLVSTTTPANLRHARPLAPKPGAGAPPAADIAWSPRSLQTPDAPQGTSPRTRKVKDKDDTAAVRDAKACLHCAIHKKKCNVETPCQECVKFGPEEQKRFCIRPGKPNLILREGRCALPDSRWTPDNSLHARLFNEPPGEAERIDITVYSSPSNWQGFGIPVVRHADNTFRIPTCATSAKTFEADMSRWAERNLGEVALPCKFQRALEDFLYLYSQGNCTEKKPLVDSVVRMAALWRLITAKQLWCTAAGGQHHQKQHEPLPASLVTQLKTIAQRMMRSAEVKAMDEISSLVPHAYGKAKDPVEAPAVWASLWAVLLVYRQSLQVVSNDAAAFKSGFADSTRRLRDALVIILSGHFRTSIVQGAVDNVCQESFLDDLDVAAAYVQVRLEKEPFYQKLQTSTSSDDALIYKYVVQSEHAVMGRKRSKGKTQLCRVAPLPPPELGPSL